MAINPSKTKYILIGTANKIKSSSRLKLTINNVALNNAIGHKILGIYMTNINTLMEHSSDESQEKISTNILLLKRISYFISFEYLTSSLLNILLHLF